MQDTENFRPAAYGSCRNVPCRRSSSRSSLTSSARGARPVPAARPAAVPAACPVIQHCGISRMKAWVAASLATWRPPTTTPSSRSGTKARYGIETVGNFWDGEGETPTSSGWRTPAFQSSDVIGCKPARRRVIRTPICGAASMIHAFSKPGGLFAEEVQVGDHAAAGLELDPTEVLDV